MISVDYWDSWCLLKFCLPGLTLLPVLGMERKMKVLSSLHATEFSGFIRTLHKYKDSSTLCGKALLVLVIMMIMTARAYLVPHDLPIWEMPF